MTCPHLDWFDFPQFQTMDMLCRVGRRGRLGHRRRRLEVARRGRLCACLGVVWALSGRCLGVVRECALSGHGGAGGLSLVQE